MNGLFKKSHSIAAGLFCCFLPLFPGYTQPLLLQVAFDGTSTMSWTTDRPAVGRLEYSNDTSYSKTSQWGTSFGTTQRVWIATSAGATYHFRVRVKDTAGKETLSGDYVVTRSGPDNSAPQLNALRPITLTSGEIRAIPVSAADNDKDPITISAAPLPAFAAFDGSLLRIPAAATAGSYPITFTAKDSKGAFDSESIVLTIKAPDAGPVIQNLQIARATADTATVLWTTDVPADSLVEYGTGGNTDQGSARNARQVKIHYQDLTALAPGTSYSFKVKSTDAAGRAGSSAIASFTTPAGQDIIELDSSIRTPYILDRPGTLYRLTADIVAARSAFGVAAPNITLDLNGHTITYAAGAPIAVPNGSFEQELSAGWDASHAPSALRFEGTFHSPATRYLGRASLAFNVPAAGEQYLISKDSILLPGGFTYNLFAQTYDFVSGWTAEHKKIKKYLQLIDADTGQPLSVYAEHGKDTGLGYYYVGTVFRLDQDRRVKIKVGITGDVSTIQSGRLYVDDVSLQPAYYYGVVDLLHYNRQEYPDLPVSSNSKAGLKIMNGTVNNSPLVKGFDCDALKVSEAEIANLHSTVYGTDANNVAGDYAAKLNIHDNTFSDSTERTSHRHNQTGGAVRITSTAGLNFIDGNSISDGPQYSINVHGHATATHTAEILGNRLSNNARVTQAYNIGAYGNGISIHGNTIDTTNGNGIMAGNDGVEIFENTIKTAMLPNQEYGWNVSGKAVELRNASNATVHHNVVISSSDAAHLPQHAMVFRECLTGNRVRNNSFTAITSDNTKRVAAFRYYHDGSADAVVENNIFASNSTLVMCEEGYAAGASFRSNTFRRLSEPSGISHFKTFYFGWLGQGMAFNAGGFFDSILENANFSEAHVYTNAIGKSSYQVGYSLGLLVQTPLGRAVEGARITIKDSNGTEIFAGATGADGTLPEPAYLAQYRYEFPRSATPVRIDLTPHTVTARKQGFKMAEQGLTLDRAQNITLILVSDSVPAAPRNLKIVP